MQHRGLIHSRSRQSGAATPANLLIFLCILIVAWLLWSGIYKPVVLGLGLFSCVLTVFLARRMGFFEQSSEMLAMGRRLPGFWLWLLKDILASSWNVAKLVLNPRLSIEPTMVEFDMNGTGELAQTILGNSITLSPGTITVDINEGCFLVHCISRENAVSLQQGDTAKRIRALSV